MGRSSAEYQISATLRALDAVDARTRELNAERGVDLALTLLPALEAARSARAHINLLIGLLMEQALQHGASPIQIGIDVDDVQP